MVSEEAKLESQVNEKLFDTFKDFMTGVTKIEELGVEGNKLLTGYQQGLEFIRRPPINQTSKLIEKIIKMNETDRLKSYIEAGCINNHARLQNLNKSKAILDELECLLGDANEILQTENECLARLHDKDITNGLSHLVVTEEEEASRTHEPQITDYAVMMSIIYCMLNQDYAMQEKIVTSLSLTSPSGELESYCLMWSLRPFISDEVMHQAWTFIP
ncbi:hypothetical protein ACFE04_003212 [Oxalis oulophora]